MIILLQDDIDGTCTLASLGPKKKKNTFKVKLSLGGMHPIRREVFMSIARYIPDYQLETSPWG
jgi:hypothetical protein